MHTTTRRTTAVIMGAAVVLSCSTATQNRDRGAAVGAAAGATVGAIIGNQSNNTARGAIIGAAVGGAAGAIIGHQMDVRARAIETNNPGVIVERIGEGIRVTFTEGLLFDYNSAELRPNARTALARFATELKDFPNTNIMIVGHTDSIGTDAYNHDLSHRRANATRDFLVAQGVAPTRFQVIGRGEAEPVASNSTAEGRQQNRRVEVALYANEALRAQARAQAGSN